MIFKKFLHDVKKKTKLYAYAASSQDRFEELARAAIVDLITFGNGAILTKPSIWENREEYMGKNEEDKVEYNMCQALREWAEEERSIGREEGQRTGFLKGQQAGADEKTRTIVRNMLLRCMEDEDIMAIAECEHEFIDKVRETL